MSKAEWGLKRVCPGCGARYYDMKKKPPVCPSCGAVFDPENLMKSRRGRVDKKAVAVAPEEAIDDIAIAEGDDTEEAVIEDAEELADTDVNEVVEVETEEER